MTSNKKIKKTIIILIIVFGIITAAVSVVAVYYNHALRDSELQKKASEQANVISSAGSAVEFMQFLDKENIEVDKEVYNKYKNAAEKMFDNLYEKNLEITSFGYLALLNSYFDLGHDDYIKSLFERFYSEKYHLLRENIDVSDSSVDERYILSFNIFPLITLNRAGFDLNEYGIEQELIDTFNKYIEKDFMNNEIVINRLESVFWYFVYTNNLDKIDYKRLRPYYFTDSFYDITDKNESLNDYFSDLRSVNFHLNIFDNDNSYQKETNEAYMELITDDDFGYFGNSDALTCIYHTVGYSFIDCINQNKNFVNKVNIWLDNVYDKEVKENGAVWLGEL